MTQQTQAETAKRGFGSDNHSGAHPRILDAVVRANAGHQPSYGTDELTRECERVFKKLFGEKTESFFVFNGTAANVLALGTLVRSHHAILASNNAHIVNDECGAPEAWLGAKIQIVPTTDGKLTPELMQPFMVRRGDQHASQVRAISITQPTEIGTIYSLHEIQRIAEFAKANGLKLHIDGARLVNAVAALGCTFREMVEHADVVSFGGTKNALLFGEAVLFPNGLHDSDFRFQRKQAMQLPSKTRFVAAQFLELLGTDLWKENAEHANAMAQKLASGLGRSTHAKLTQKVQANGCFVILPKALVSKLREHYFFYVWDEHTF
ncbi:MAG: aminotransferase class V-fold PLP-dependent enzyme, partial [Proteobacteria bacterium]